MDTDDPLSQSLLELPSSTKKDLAAINCSLASSITLWLKKHGKSVRPKLSAEQKQQLKECFELMDQDGSGAIDSDELGAAFKLLGIKMKMSELVELVQEVDHDGSGEVEYLEFLEIMTTTLQRLAEERESDENTSSDGQVPFALMATAYRRKRLMEGIISGDKEVMTQITQLSERQAQEAASAATRSAAEELAMRGERGAEAEVRKMLNTITKKSLERLSAMRVDQNMLMSLSPEERRLLAQVAARVGSPPQGSARPGPSPVPLPPVAGATNTAAPTPGQQGPGTGAGCLRRSTWGPSSTFGPLAGSAVAAERSSGFGRSTSQVKRLPLVPTSKWQHYTRTAGHHQLLEMPQVFGLKFSKPTLKLGMAGGGRGALNGALPGLPNKPDTSSAL